MDKYVNTCKIRWINELKLSKSKGKLRHPTTVVISNMDKLQGWGGSVLSYLGPFRFFCHITPPPRPARSLARTTAHLREAFRPCYIPSYTQSAELHARVF